MFRWFALMVVAASAGIWFGCDDLDTKSAESSEMYIEPANLVMRKGQSQTFTAVGGYDYKWSVDNESVGVLNPRTGSTVTYTVVNSAATGSVVTISVVSYIEGRKTTVDSSTNSTTVATPYRAVAQAVVLLK
jgi:hypothetical protein